MSINFPSGLIKFYLNLNLNLKILNVYDMYKLELGVFMYKHFNDQLPPIFNDYFNKLINIHNRNTRNIYDYQLMRNRTEMASRGVRSSGPRLWNTLPSHIQMSLTAKNFKAKFKNDLINKYV